jgi:cytochrome b involved in lipid metabolism
VLNKKPDARKLLVVGNKVYDITEFMFDHPGGPSVIATQEGRDATGKKQEKKTRKIDFFYRCVS